jgi:hypothetical protein
MVTVKCHVKDRDPCESATLPAYLLDKYQDRCNGLIFGPFGTSKLASRLAHVRIARALLETRLKDCGYSGESVILNGVVKLGEQGYCQLWTTSSEDICRSILKKTFHLRDPTCNHIGHWTIIERFLPHAPRSQGTPLKLNSCAIKDRMRSALSPFKGLPVAVWPGKWNTALCSTIEAVHRHNGEITPPCVLKLCRAT